MFLRFVAKIGYIILIFIEIVIGIRIVFRLVGAEEGKFIVDAVYAVSDIFVKPFEGVVSAEWSVASFTIDVDALVALAIYMILGFAVIELIKVFSPSQPLK